MLFQCWPTVFECWPNIETVLGEWSVFVGILAINLLVAEGETSLISVYKNGESSSCSLGSLFVWLGLVEWAGMYVWHPNRTTNVYAWTVPTELQSEPYVPADTALSQFVGGGFRISRTVRMTYESGNISSFQLMQQSCVLPSCFLLLTHSFTFFCSFFTFNRLLASSLFFVVVNYKGCCCT